MSIDESRLRSLNGFWLNLRTAMRWLNPTVCSKGAEPDIEASKLLRNCDVWLTPASVRGFRAEDFDFLDEPARTNLAAAVARFSEVAATVPRNGPATTEQVRVAEEAFGVILDNLRPERFSDGESFRAQHCIEQLLAGKLPPWVSGFACRRGVDFLGEPVMRIEIEIADQAAADRVDGKEVLGVGRLFERAYERIADGEFPFVSFRIRPQPGELPKVCA